MPTPVSTATTTPFSLAHPCRQATGLVASLALGIFCLIAKLFVTLVQTLWSSRLGLPYLMGLRLIPRTPAVLPGSLVRREVYRYCRKEGSPLVPLKLFRDEPMPFDAVICYPRDYDRSDRSRVVLYHGGGSEIFGRILYEVEHLAQLRQCPVICYDYRGIGMNGSRGINRLPANLQSIQEDAYRTTVEVAGHYKIVEIFGASLGAGIAAVATERFLDEHPGMVRRISFTALDGYSAVREVYSKRLTWLVDFFKRNFSPVSSLKNLAARGVRMTMISQKRDRLIPKRARLAYLPCLADRDNVRTICSKPGEHGLISYELDSHLCVP